MIATSLTAALAVVIAAPESVLVQETPYASVAPAASNQPRVLRDQDAALFRQGLAAARALRKAPVDLVLIDRRNYHLFQPLLYQVAAAALSPADIACPIRSILADQANARVELGRVTGDEELHRAGQQVLDELGELDALDRMQPS